MKVIRSVLKDRTALAERLLPEMQHGGIFVPKAVDLAVGETVCLWLQLRHLSADLHIYGVVYWLRHRGGRAHQHLRTGAGIGFRTGQEDAVEFLRQALEGQARSFRERRPSRTPLLNPWRCEIQLGHGDFRPAMATDISKDGAQCIVGSLPLEPDATVALRFPWHSETAYRMRVAWQRRADSRFRLGLQRLEGAYPTEREWSDLAGRARRLFASQLWTRASQSPSTPEP